MSQYLFFLLILACPLMMIFMMRGGHGHGAHGGHMGSTTGGGATGSQHDDCEHDENRQERLTEAESDVAAHRALWFPPGAPSGRRRPADAAPPWRGAPTNGWPSW